VTTGLAAVRTPSLAGLLSFPFIALWLLDGFWKPKLFARSVAGFWAVDFAEWVLLPCALLFLLHRLSFISKRDYGLAAPLGARDIAITTLLCFASLFLINALGTALGRILFGNAPGAFGYLPALRALGSGWLAGTFYLSATAAVCESIFTLSLPWLALSGGNSLSRARTLACAAGLALLFGLGHWETGWANATGAAMFQLGALWWYLRLKTLWPVIGAHFLIDLYWLWPPAT
jgi:hypothetical protein